VTVAFIVPDIAGVPTGGNLYNRSILEAWPSGYDPPRVIAWPVDTVPDAPTNGIGDEPRIVIDSLCLKHPEAVRALREVYPDAPTVLLAHYLNCIDPRSGDRRSAEEERDLLSILDGAITPSRFVRDALTEEGVPAEGIHVVSPGLDDAFRRPAPDRVGRDRPTELLTVANLLPGKGLDVLLDALARVQDLDWIWRLVGGADLDAAYGEAFLGRIRDSTFGDRVSWEGTIERGSMPCIYDRADVFVLPSRFETCSMATREAMARGLPVVASRVGGLPENLGGEAAGCLVRPDDPVALSAIVRLLVEDVGRREAMGAAAKRQSDRFPSWREAAQQFRRGVHQVAITER